MFTTINSCYPYNILLFSAHLGKERMVTSKLIYKKTTYGVSELLFFRPKGIPAYLLNVKQNSIIL